MKTLELINGDLLFENGDFKIIEREKEVAQCISISMGTNLGEWFLNEAFGMEHSRLLGKSTDGEARAEVIRVLGQEDRINEIKDIELINNRKERERRIEYEISLIDGTLIREEESVGA